MVILLDAMGGDNAPDEAIKGAVKAINEIEAEVLLIGKEEVILQKIKEFYGKEKAEPNPNHGREAAGRVQPRARRAVFAVQKLDGCGRQSGRVPYPRAEL